MNQRLQLKPDEPQFPWEGDECFAACNFAFGDLFRNLPAQTVFDGQIHVREGTAEDVGGNTRRG